MAHSCGFKFGVIEGINQDPMRAIERTSLVFNTINSRSGVQYTGRTLFEARQEDQTMLDIHTQLCTSSPVQQGCQETARYNLTSHQ